MSKTELMPADLRQQAQAVDIRALEALLSQAIAHPSARLEASRRDHTLYVFLATPSDDPPAHYAEKVYEAIQDLRLADLTRLIVLDGRDGAQVDRWRKTFVLPAVEFGSVASGSVESGSVESDSVESSSVASGSAASGSVASGSVASGSVESGSVESSSVESGSVESDSVESGSVESGPVESGPVESGSVESSSVEGKFLWPRSAELELPPTHPPTLAQVPLALPPAKRGKHPWLGVALLGLIALALGLGAGIAQWHNQRLTSGTRAPSPPPPLAPVFSQPQMAALAAHRLQPPATLTINAVGDIIPGTDYQMYRLPQDWQYLFRSIQYQLADADLVFGNFESTLTEVPSSAKDTSRAMTFAFRTPPWYASVLKEAGFDVLSVANNHSFDFGEQGFAETIGHIEAAGMKAVGRQGEILYVDVNGTTVAFIAFSHLSRHNTVHDLEAAAALVQTAEAQADVVVVSFHAGKEGSDAVYTRDQTEYFYSENRGNVVQFSRTVIDHGADLVLGHGPHVPRALELYQNKLIAYSLGNFLGYRTLSTVGPLGVSLILQTRLNAQGDFVSGRIIPVALDPNGVPYLDDYFQSVVLLRSYTQRDFPQTPLEIDDMGYVWRKE